MKFDGHLTRPPAQPVDINGHHHSGNYCYELSLSSDCFLGLRLFTAIISIHSVDRIQWTLKATMKGHRNMYSVDINGHLNMHVFSNSHLNMHSVDINGHLNMHSVDFNGPP